MINRMSLALIPFFSNQFNSSLSTGLPIFFSSCNQPIVDSVRWSYRARPQLKYCIAEPDNTRRKTRRRKWPEMFYIPIKNLLIAVEKRAFTLVLSYIESFSQGLCCLQRKENRLYGSWRKNTTNQVDSEKRTYSVQEIEEILQISLKASCSMESGIWSIWRWLAR